MDGILVIDKASGPTSFDVVRMVRKRANQKKVGHAGTLDPLASGLLVVCLGQATRLVPYLMDGEKTYAVRIALGRGTDTLDADGEVTETKAVPSFDESGLREVLRGFIGQIEQTPPKYSAIKQNGEALYKKARRGERVDVSPREVVIHAIDIDHLTDTDIALTIRCEKGTYIRSLARDIAVRLGTVGHVTVLRRTATSGFQLADALSFEQLKQPDIDLSKHLLPLSKGAAHLLHIELSEADERAIRFGQSIPFADSEALAPSQTAALMSEDGELVALAEHRGDGLKPFRVFPKP